MAKLSMGAFKKNLGLNEEQGEDNTGEVNQDVEPQEEENQQEPVQNQEPEQNPEPVEPTETEVSTQTEPVEGEASEDNTSPEDIEPSGSSLETEDSSGSISPEPELNDDLVAKYLSEKLGKEVSSLEDLTKESSNPLDEDPYVKEFYEWRKKTGGRSAEDFVKYQQDFSKVSDLDVAREFLQLEYPESTPEEINLELKRFTESEDDLDEEVQQKKWELKKYATKGRKELEKLKADLGEPNQNSLAPEIQEKVKLADQIQDQIKSNQKAQDDYFQGIKNTAKSVEKMSLELGEGNNIDFVVSEEDRKSVPDFINQMPHWKKEDGSWNHKAVVEDGIKIKNFDKMIKLAFEQGKNSGKDDLIRETKNVNLKDTGSSAQPDQKSNKPIYENESPKKRLKVRKFGKR